MFVRGGARARRFESQRRPARRRLHRRKRSLSLRAHLQRRELEPGAARAADAARRRSAGRRVSPRGQRPRSSRERKHLQLLSRDGRQASRADGRARSIRRRLAPGHGDSGRERVSVAQPRVDRRQSTAGRRAQRRAARLRLLPDTGLGGFTNFNRYYLLADREARASSSTSASITAVKSPTTSSTTSRASRWRLPCRATARTALEPLMAIYRPEGDDHQPVRRFGRRCAAVALP